MISEVDKKQHKRAFLRQIDSMALMSPQQNSFSAIRYKTPGRASMEETVFCP